MAFVECRLGANTPPAKKLVEFGLARWETKHLSSPHCIITDEGKKMVAEWSER